MASLKIPAGYRLEWSGEYEYLIKTRRAAENGHSADLTDHLCSDLSQHQIHHQDGIVLLAVPFSLVGSFWLLYLLNYNMSIAVWVGIIALAGLDAETGVVMLLYLDLAYEQWKKEGRLKSQSPTSRKPSCTGRSSGSVPRS